MARLAQGAAVALLTAVFSAMLLAFLVHRLHGGPYIPIILPALCGAAMGGLIAMARGRMGALEPKIGLGAAILAGIIFVLGFQTLIYIRSLDVMGSGGEDAASVIAEAGAGSGWWGFLTWTSTSDMGGELSPLGVIGRMKLGPVMTVAVIVVELLVTIIAAVRFEQRKIAQFAAAASQAPPAQAAPPPKREQLAERLDAETLLGALQAVDAGDFEAAAKTLGGSGGSGTHRIYLTFVPNSMADWTLEVTEVADGADEVTKATRTVSSWDGQTLLDELRLGQAG